MSLTETRSFAETVKYDAAGLVTVVVQDAQNGEVHLVKPLPTHLRLYI